MEWLNTGRSQYSNSVMDIVDFASNQDIDNAQKLRCPRHARLERGLAWILFSIGAIILLTYSGFKAVESIISDPQLAGILKAAILMVIGGSVILLVSVVREKLFTRKSDPYKEVQR